MSVNNELESEVVEYSGRKTSRSGSERRRKAILEGALRVVVREGVRGVRHRAVAKEAGVPLSATTYYFNDIVDLIADTFIFFAESSIEALPTSMHKDIIHYVRHEGHQKFMSGDLGMHEAINVLAEMISLHLIDQVQHHRDHLIAEQAFLLEAKRNDKLSALGLLYKQKQHSGYHILLNALGVKAAEQRASMLFNVLQQMKQDMLFAGSDLLEKPLLIEKINLVLKTLLLP